MENIFKIKISRFLLYTLLLYIFTSKKEIYITLFVYPCKLTTTSSHVLKQNKTPNKLLSQKQIIGFEFSYWYEFAISFSSVIYWQPLAEKWCLEPKTCKKNWRNIWIENMLSIKFFSFANRVKAIIIQYYSWIFPLYSLWNISVPWEHCVRSSGLKEYKRELLETWIWALPMASGTNIILNGVWPSSMWKHTTARQDFNPASLVRAHM